MFRSKVKKNKTPSKINLLEAFIQSHSTFSIEVPIGLGEVLPITLLAKKYRLNIIEKRSKKGTIVSLILSQSSN